MTSVSFTLAMHSVQRKEWHGGSVLYIVIIKGDIKWIPDYIKCACQQRR